MRKWIYRKLVDYYMKPQVKPRGLTDRVLLVLERFRWDTL